MSRVRQVENYKSGKEELVHVQPSGFANWEMGVLSIIVG